MFYSQFGEDKILFDIFQKKTDGVCIEVGANNGVDDSTSLFFEEIGWKCILVEPNPYLCQNIRNVRKSVLYEYAASNQNAIKTLYVVEGAPRSHGMSTISTDSDVHDRIKSQGFESVAVQVHAMTLDQILADAQIDEHIDFISIDVEGHEYAVLEGFSVAKWKPSILLIEDNSRFADNRVSKYLRQFGYVRFMRTGVNDWYAPRTNKRLVNIRSKIGISRSALINKSKNVLRKIPFIMKINSRLKARSVE